MDAAERTLKGGRMNRDQGVGMLFSGDAQEGGNKIISGEAYVPFTATNYSFDHQRRNLVPAHHYPASPEAGFDVHGNFPIGNCDRFAYPASFTLPPPGFSPQVRVPHVRPPLFYNELPPQGMYSGSGSTSPNRSPMYASMQQERNVNQISITSGTVPQTGYSYRQFGSENPVSVANNENGGNPFLFESHRDDHPVSLTKSRSPVSEHFGDKNSGNPGDKQSKNVPVIQPMIENIVASMNGTYTHFGNARGDGFQEGLVSGVHDSYRISLEEFDVASTRYGGSNVTDSDGPSSLDGIRGPYNSVNTKPVGESGAGAVGSGLQQRSVTPKDGMDSRPQTPGKRSYSEVLARNEPRCTQSSTKTIPTTSNPPSPGLCNMMGSAATVSSRRSSSSSLHLADGSREHLACSNASSTSSSPLVQPRKFGEEEVKKYNKGKENNSNSSSKVSTAKNSPSTSPQHNGVNWVNHHATQSGKSTRKILNTNSQNSQLHSNSSSHSSKFTTKAVPKSKSFPFEFEINDIDDEDQLSDPVSSNYRAARKNTGGGTADFKTSLSNDDEYKDKSDDENDGYCGKSHTHQSNNTVAGVSSGYDRKGGTGFFGGLTSSAGLSARSSRGQREKQERSRQRKGARHCTVQRVRVVAALWLGHLVYAMNWLWTLVINVGTLSCSLALNLLQDLCCWWKTVAVPSCRTGCRSGMLKMKNFCAKVKMKLSWKTVDSSDSGAATDSAYKPKGDQAEILAMMGPDKNIALPGSGEEALKRLLSVKGQDPYSILGIRSDSSDEVVRRYYKKQAVLVHPDKNVVPGAEEGFKILQRAFELVGEPSKRLEYHRQILEAHEKERVFGEIGNLLEQLRKKMESVTNSIRCTKCNSRHKKNRTDRPLFAARYCAQCRINHGAREGDLWAEKRGFFGFSRQFFACMEGSIWEINEWASCQRKNLKHLQPDSHNIMYRLVAGGKGCPGNASQGPSQGCGKSGKNTKWENSSGGASPTQGEGMGGGSVPSSPVDDWHTVINNLCRSSHGQGMASGPPPGNVPQTQTHSSKSFNSHTGSSTPPNPSYSGGGNRVFNGSVFNMMNGMAGANNTAKANSQFPGKSATDATGSSRKRGKVKRK